MHRTTITIAIIMMVFSGCTGQGVGEMTPAKLLPADPSPIPAGVYKGTVDCTDTLKDQNGATVQSQDSSGEYAETFSDRGIPMNGVDELMINYVKTTQANGLSLRVTITAITPSADGLTVSSKASGSGSSVGVSGTSSIVYQLQNDGTIAFTQTNKLQANSILVSGVTDEQVCSGTLTPQ